jgi:anti-sigma B factor antagonist
VSVQSQFRSEVHNQGEMILVALSGELDLASSGALGEELTRVVDAASGLVVVDLRGLEFMDSTGLSTLVKAHQRAEQAGKRFALVRGSQQVQRLLNLTGVEDRMLFADSPEELVTGG